MSQPRIRSIEIELERWPRERDGFRIVQISDIHIGALRGRAFAESLTQRVNALDADLIAVTGDLVDGKVSAIGPEVEPFSGLRAPFGVYFVTGNHEYYGSEYHATHALLTSKIRDTPRYRGRVHFLQNECIEFEELLPGLRLFGSTMWVHYPKADDDENIAIQYEYKVRQVPLL